MMSKERMLCALHEEKPGRLPGSVHQWQSYHLEKHLGGISALEAFARFGPAAQIQCFESMGQFWLVEADFSKFSTAEWVDDARVVRDDPDDCVVHHTIRTPAGTLTYENAGNRNMVDLRWKTEVCGFMRDKQGKTVCSVPSFGLFVPKTGLFVPKIFLSVPNWRRHFRPSALVFRPIGPFFGT
jgi:hypothetical protein